LKKSSTANLYVALMHYPVVNKNGAVIASAVTNLDLHDIARAAKTYGVQSFYVVTPLEDQRKLVEDIVDHWTRGNGAAYNPSRRDAMELIRIRNSLEQVADDVRTQCRLNPRTVVTCARRKPECLGYGELREMIQTENPYILVFGTAWGLCEEVFAQADYVLEPVAGSTAYNHLSVRSAVAIILDRLMGPTSLTNSGRA